MPTTVVLLHILLESTLVLIIRWVCLWLHRQLRTADIPRDDIGHFALEATLTVSAYLPSGCAAMLSLVFLFVGALAVQTFGPFAAMIAVSASLAWGTMALNDWRLARAMEEAR